MSTEGLILPLSMGGSPLQRWGALCAQERQLPIGATPAQQPTFHPLSCKKSGLEMGSKGPFPRLFAAYTARGRVGEPVPSTPQLDDVPHDKDERKGPFYHVLVHRTTVIPNNEHTQGITNRPKGAIALSPIGTTYFYQHVSQQGKGGAGGRSMVWRRGEDIFSPWIMRALSPYWVIKGVIILSVDSSETNSRPL